MKVYIITNQFESRIFQVFRREENAKKALDENLKKGIPCKIVMYHTDDISYRSKKS